MKQQQTSLMTTSMARAKMTPWQRFVDKFILSESQKPVAMFILLITLFSLVSTIFAAYSACFGAPEAFGFKVFNSIMEVCFVIDLVRNFFMEFTDPGDPRKPVRNFLRIA